MHTVEIIDRLRRHERTLLVDPGREPSTEELAKELDIAPERVLEVRALARAPISLDQSIGGDGDAQIGEFIEDFEAVVAVDAVSFTLLQDQLRSELATLTEREAGVVRLRYGLTDGQACTLEEIGRVQGWPVNASGRSNPRRWPNLRHPARSQALRDPLIWFPRPAEPGPWPPRFPPAAAGNHEGAKPLLWWMHHR